MLERVNHRKASLLTAHLCLTSSSVQTLSSLAYLSVATMASLYSFNSDLAEHGSVQGMAHSPRYPGLDDGNLAKIRIMLLLARSFLMGLRVNLKKRNKSVKRHKRRMEAIIEDFDRQFYGSG